MQLIIFKPTTPSKRHYLNIFKLFLKPTIKTNLKKIKQSIGRNNKGKITVKHKNIGHKKLYRKINFKNKYNFIGIIFSIEYDPYRNSFISSVFDLKKKYFQYFISAKNTKIGCILKAGKNCEIKIGNILKLKKIPIGCPIFNISTQKNNNSKIARSAGTFSLPLTQKKNYAKILLNSGKTKKLNNNCFCSIGIVSNEFFFLKQLGKAGRSRWIGIKPSVRGVAMNPVDHPNGGGEGKKSPKNYWV